MSTMNAAQPVGTDALRSLADSTGLSPVGRRPGLWAYTRSLWDHRDFILTMARSGLRAKSSNDRLGSVWLVLTPLLQGLVYFFVFGLLLGVARDVENFVGFLVIGVIFFQHISQSMVQGSRAVSGNRKLIQALAFPRAALPIASSLRSSMGFLPALAVVFVIVFLSWLPEVRIGWRVVLVVPLVLLIAVFNLGLAMITARFTAHVNDLGNLLPLFTRLWLYTSGVFYPVERYAADNPVVLSVLTANPMHIFLTLGRDAILWQQDSSWQYWAGAAGWAFGLLVVGYLVFWQAEEEYTRD
ncbi:ABC transporter permease [Jannaschia sp. R86511]|uniref:ABC transporter permease n=1 Tax=Jannaschia sp. R86511 TaxID=3093853 RepID=UPI0036D3052D